MLKVTLDLEKITWGELRRFTALGAHLDDVADVDLTFNEHREIVALSLDLPHGGDEL